MNKANKLGGAIKPAQKRPPPKQRLTKTSIPRKAHGRTGLAEVVAQLAESAEKLVQAADRLSDTTTQLSVAAEVQRESSPTPGQSADDMAAPQQESEVTDATDSE
jgi:hypothetical protein